MASDPLADHDEAPIQSPEDSAMLDKASSDGAPRYPIPSRRLAAVEIPAVVNNIDRAVKAFGRVPSLSHVSAHCRDSASASDQPHPSFWISRPSLGLGSSEKLLAALSES